MTARRPLLPAALSLVTLAGCGGGSSTPSAATDGADASDASGDTSTNAAPDGGDVDAPGCTAPSIFAAPDGAGTACSCDAPCALETARDLALSRLGAATSDVVVTLRGGAYRLARPFSLDASHPSTNGARLVFLAAAGESPTLVGALHVTGFTLVDAAHGVWAASVPKGTRSRQLFVNGRRATRARGASAPSGFTKTSTGFALGDATMASWPDRGGIELVGTREWKAFRCPVTSVDASGIAVASGCWSASQAQSGYTWDALGWIENARELLDAPGEFFLDGDAGTLFYAPRAGEDLASADVELPVLEELLHVEGTPSAPVQNVTFDGVGFAYATWLAPTTIGYAPVQAGFGGNVSRPHANVLLRGTHGVSMTGCRFAHLGGAGVSMELGSQGNSIERSSFEDISGAAVLVGDVRSVDDHHPTDPALVVRDEALLDSWITRAGAEFFDEPGVFVGYTTHTTLARNELFDLPYTGISVGWGWGSVDVGGAGGYTTPSTSQQNEISQNRVGYVMRVLRDGGGIYVLGAQGGSTMSGNWLEEQAAPFGNLYLDNGSQGWAVSGNVVLLHDKADVVPGSDPGRSYWTYVQVYDPIAKNNALTGNFTNDPTLFTPKPIDPSNTLGGTTTIVDLASVAAIDAAAGSPLRSPEIARGKPCSASSTYDASHPAEQANDGDAFDGWSPTGGDAHPTWTVDLGALYDVDAIEVVSRWTIDQSETRRSYRVIGATDASFGATVVLGEVDATGLPHRAIFAASVAPAARVRFVRVEKTAPEYFFLAEVRVHGRAAP